jgi:TRAP-type mannitol/chloroaromatic compound transport system substrate-binding protein
MQTKQGVKFYKTPDAVLQKQIDIFDEVVTKKSAENPLFKEVVESQRKYAERAVRWDLDTNVNRRMAYNHYFVPKKGAPKKA